VGCELDRNLTAQRGVYEGVLDELRRGRKTGHWIWFIIPRRAAADERRRL